MRRLREWWQAKLLATSKAYEAKYGERHRWDPRGSVANQEAAHKNLNWP